MLRFGIARLTSFRGIRHLSIHHSSRKNILVTVKQQQAVRYSSEGNRNVMSIVELDSIPAWNCSVEGHKAKAFHAESDVGMRISLWSGDITKLRVDAIVNAANSQLAGGGGVDGAIHRAAGAAQLQAACRALNGCSIGSAKITRGFELPAKYIIHCVGPTGGSGAHLESAYRRAMTLCTENDIRTVAFPCIATGVYGFPNERAAEVATRTVIQYLLKYKEIERVIFCVFLREDYEIYLDKIPKQLAKRDSLFNRRESSPPSP